MGNFDKVEKSNHRHLAKCVVFFIAVSIIFMLAFFLSFRKVENEHTYVATAATADTIRVNTLDGLQNAINAKIYNEIIVENEIVLTDGVVVDGIKESGERTVVRVEVLGTTDQGVIQSSSSEQHVFTVRKGATATLRNLIIKGGSKTAIINGESSSSLENNSKLICENLTISNASNSSAGGGGICNTKGCTTIMKKCNIVRNSAKYGGGFQNQQGLFIMEDCSVSENRSFSNGGGGGENTGESTSSRDAILYLINTTVANNTSDEIGGGINAKNGMLYIINSTISGNITSHTTLSADRNCGGGIGNNGSYIYAINSLLTDNIDYKQVSGQTQGVPSDIGIYTTTSDASKNVLVGCMYGSISPQGPDDGSEKNIQVTANNANIYASKNQSSFIKRDGTSDPNYVFDYPALVANDAGILTAPLADQSIANDEQVEETFFYYPQNVTYATKNLIYSGYTPSVGSEKVAFTGEYSAAVDAGRVVPDYIGAGSPIQASEKIITIRVQSNDDFTIDGGSVFGDSFIINTTVGKDITLKANQKEGKEDYAVVWYDSKGSLLSGKNPYSFNTTDNITIQPTSFSVTAKTEKNSNSVQLEWTALDNITDYTLYYGEIDLFEKYSVTQQYSATSATINGLEYGKTYYFWVVPMSNDIVFNSAKASVSIQGGKNNKNAPTNISKVDQQKIGVNDGMITNVDDTMEYFAENEWKKITGNSVSNLAPGEYPVRYAEADNYFASPSVVVTILKKEITSLEIISQPKLKSYICGQTLDLSSLEIKISYSTNTIVRVGYDSFANRDSYDSINQIQVFIGEIPIESSRKISYTDTGSVIKISCDGKQTETDSLEVIQSYSVTVTNPTCIDKGYTTHKCSGCGHSYDDNFTEVIEHSFGEWESKADGKHTKTCSVCKSIETEECKYGTEVTDPTCTDKGYTTHTCSGCGHSYKDNPTEVIEHSFGEWESKADGKHTKTCSVCKSIETEECKYETEVTNPTCTDAGYTTHKCKDCEHSYTVDGELATGHSFGQWVYNNDDGTHTKTCTECMTPTTENCDDVTDVIDPTCIDKGYTTHKCSGCGHSYDDNFTEVIEHSFSKWVYNNDGTHTKTCTECMTPTTENCDDVTDVIDPTCIDKGYTMHKCSGCGHSYQDNITNATGHSFGEWESKADGKHTKTCSVCKSIETEECKYETEVTNPTCTDAGYTTHKCSECGHSYDDNFTEVIEHSFSKWVYNNDGTHTKTCTECMTPTTEKCIEDTVVTDPTCTKQGYTTHTCSGCGHSYQDNITNAIGHSFGEWESKADGKHTKTCSVCKSIETEECKYGTEVTDPTCTDKGYTTHTCKDCEHSYTVDGELATGHSFGEWKTTVQATCVDNGEEKKTCLNAKCEKTETKVILAKHSCTKIEKKDATCTVDGNIDYWQCEVCYLYFSDNKAEEQINLADTTIFALNHNYQAATYVWADNYDCTGKRICSRDKTHIEEFTMKATHEVIQELSCLEDETVRYTAIFEQTGFETQTKTIITKAAQHFFELNLTQDEAPTCTEKGSKSKHCSKCSMTTDKTSINPLGHDMKELIIKPTCNEKGYTKHSCTRCEHSFNDTFIDELGHTYVFYDMDGSTVLKSDRVACGYQINAPDMEMERVIGQFKYLFGGWSQEIPTALTQDIEISAIYKAIRISENIDNAEKQEHKDDEIIIEMPNGIDDNLRLIVKHISDETEIARNNESLLLSEVLSEYSTSYMLDIYLERNDKRSDMLDYSSVIKIRIDDIPNFNIEEFTLVQVNQDGGYDLVSFEIVDDYIVFETNTLGSFLVIERTIGTIYFWWLCIMQAGVLMTLSLYALRRNKKKRNAKENK